MVKPNSLTAKLVLLSIIFIAINMINAIIFIPIIPYGIYIFLGIFAVSFIVITFISTKLYKYICGNCHEKFTMKYSQVFSHYAGAFRKLECPHCHEETWCAPTKKH